MSVSRLSKQSIQAGFPKQQTVWDQSSFVAGMDALGSVTFTTTQTAVTFSSVPQTYTHLQVRGTYLGNGGTVPLITLNGDATASYSIHGIRRNSGAFNSYGTANYSNYQVSTVWSSSTTYPGIFIADILDYTNTNKYKTMRGLSGSEDNGGSSGGLELNSGLWYKAGSGVTSPAVTSVTVTISGSGAIAGSTIALYGIK
jgi:hypothetical protein